jgi:HD superfamily phosphohydrolase
MQGRKNMNDNLKIVCDLIHRYIKISKDVENIINDESFQRLKYIRQTTAYHLYPSANHTRFEHSLGVMKLADDFFTVLECQFKKIYENDRLNEKNIDEKIKFNSFHLKFASLLHDVGHPPLSHLGEKFYSTDDIKIRINKQVSELKLGTWNCETLKKGNPHEWMSVLVVICNFYKKLNKIFHDNEIKIDYEYIARIITGNKYGDKENPGYWDMDLIISIVNSETIDVDKLDYLMRDNFMSGMVGPKIDIERLLSSLIITEKKKLGFSKVGVSAIQKVIECRDSIYLWVCNHHTVVYTDYLLQECIKHMNALYRFNNDANNDPPEYINERRIKHKKDKIQQFYKDYSKQDGTLKIKDNMSADEKKACIMILREIEYLPYREAFNIDDYFSIDAILEKKVTDNEVYALINDAKYLRGKGKLSASSERLINQLMDRNFLKPIWKTLYQYQQFIEKHFLVGKRKDAIAFITSTHGKNRGKIVSIICKKIDCRPGEIFLIVRENKFYFDPQLSKILISSHDSDGNEVSYAINKLLPQKDFHSMYNEVAFYLYCRKEKEREVIREFKKLMNDYEKIESIYDEMFK